PQILGNYPKSFCQIQGQESTNNLFGLDSDGVSIFYVGSDYNLTLIQTIASKNASIAVQNELLFIAHHDGILIYNRTNQTNPSLLGNYSFHQHPTKVIVNQNSLYIADERTGSVRRINVSNPANMQLLSAYPTGLATGMRI